MAHMEMKSKNDDLHRKEITRLGHIYQYGYNYECSDLLDYLQNMTVDYFA